MPIRIAINKCKCLRCEDIIESTYRHDFKTCKCGAVSVGGGLDYIRRCGDPLAMYDMSEFVGDKDDTDNC